MDDLDFTHNVPEIPAGAQTQPYQRQEKANVTQFPDVQNAITNYADSTNWMSLIGSKVASIASQALATKIGGELGKNPHGDLGIGVPITDFDKTMENSYKAQAQATLGLQANKLISDSNLEASKADRMTPGLIQKTNQSISVGLKKIFANAPADIQPDLEAHYGSLQITQASDMHQRMIHEDKEERKNKAALASHTYAENASSLGMQGDERAGQAVIETTKRLVDSQVAVGDITPVEAKARLDTVRQSFLSGKITHDYEQAKLQFKGEDYLKDVADGKVIKTDSPDYMSVSQNLLTYVSHQDALRSQDQSLALTTFQVGVATNPLSPDMPQQLQNLKEKVSPESYEKAQLYYINAVKAFNQEQGNVSNALAAWNSPGAFAHLTDKGINQAFDMQVNRLVQQRQQEGHPISRDEAEVQVAASAGGQVTVFKKELENKLLRGSTPDIISAANQMQLLNHMEQGRVYDGISQKAKAIATLFQQQQGSMPDNDLARKITDELSNVDGTMQKTLDNSWNLVLVSKGAAGIGASTPLYAMALQEVGLVKIKDYSSVGGQYFAVLYGNDIYNQLNSNFMATRGDYNAALKMTQDYVDNHYGTTYINGYEQKTDSPVEKYIDKHSVYPGNNMTTYIQQDLLNQLQPQFEAAKKNSPNDYWETLPLKNGVAEVIRTVNGKKYQYPVNLVGRAGNQWDVILNTPYGQRNLFLVAPHVGVTSYQPNIQDIDKNFKANRKKG